ncbi:hypothetical protein HY969_02655 [Candidatus Kaiserbacteria bacterium]|nr:hypothetical protein [Candidatus Kaiserbacteria bacterium]
MDFDSLTKASALRSTLRALDDDNKIGDRVLDIGSGPLPVSTFLLRKKTSRKIVNMDVADFGDDPRGNLNLRYNVNNADDPNAYSTKKTIFTAAQHFGVDLSLSQGTEQVDTMIFSELLNYVDFRSVLSSYARYLKAGGRFIILNKPGHHPRNKADLLHPKGVQNNAELIDFLQNDFVIEQKTFPFRREEGLDDARSEGDAMMLLVARKK